MHAMLTMAVCTLAITMQRLAGTVSSSCMAAAQHVVRHDACRRLRRHKQAQARCTACSLGASLLPPHHHHTHYTHAQPPFRPNCACPHKLLAVPHGVGKAHDSMQERLYVII